MEEIFFWNYVSLQSMVGRNLFYQKKSGFITQAHKFFVDILVESSSFNLIV